MADDTEEPVSEGNADVATAPTEPSPPAETASPEPEINHARALGFSRRGRNVARGSDAPPAPEYAPEPEPQAEQPGAFQGSPSARPVEPLTAERSERHAAARAALAAKAQADWQQRYTDSQPVPANGPRLKEKDYRAAETAADSAAAEKASEESFARKTKNAASEAQMRASGQQFYRDAGGNLQPVLEPGTGRPLFHQTPWEEGVHPQTGEPTLTKVDRYGQRQYKPATLIAPTDTSDNQLYYKMPDGTLTPAGDMDKLMKHADPRIARTALRAVHQRNATMWKEAIAPMEEEAGKAASMHEVAQQQSVDLQSQIDEVNNKISALDANTMQATEGGFMGIGAKPTAAAKLETSKNNALLSQLDQLTKAKGEIDATVKPGGSLWQTRKKAALDLAIFKAKATHDNYLDAAAERRLILKNLGKPEAGDPILASILQAQQTYGNAISKYGSMAAQQQQPQRVSHDELVKTSGVRLDTGAAVPGQPGVFESQAGPPHAIDPVVDPENPNAPPPPHSKYTLVGSSATQAQTPPPPTGINPPAAGAAPAKPTTAAGKIDPALASEPFALAARGEKNVGEVSLKDMAARYGSGQGAVQPSSLVKIKNRLDEINATLNEPDTIDKVMAGAKAAQLDGKVRAGLEKEHEYLTALSTQRFARLTPDQQDRVTQITRDPTFWDKIKGAGKSLAEAAASGGASVMKGAALASNFVSAGEAGGEGRVMGNLMFPELVKGETEKNPLYRAGSFIDEAAKETYAKNPHEEEGMVSQALNEAAKGAGGFAPLVASGPGAPLTIGLQTAGDQMENIYQDAIAKGAKPDVAAKMAVKRAMLSGTVQAALFALLPKPLQKATSKLIVDKITGNALTKFLTNRLAQGAEGAILGGTSAAAANLTEGRPVTEGVGGAAVGLGTVQALFPRNAHPTERKPGAPEAPKPAEPAPVEPAAPAEPFKPTGEGLPKSAAESAKTLVPEAEKIAAETPPAAKSAEESARAFKAHEELNRRAAAKEESAQKFVDQIQEATGKSRGEILATRAGKDIDAWHAELKKEAAYQKNPLAVDPDRRATELHADLKKLDSEWQDHLTKTHQEAEAAAEIQKIKDSLPRKSAEEAARESDRQKKLGVELPEARTQARHDALMARRDAIESELATTERLRKSPEGRTKLKSDLSMEAKRAANAGEPPPEGGAPAKPEPIEPTPAPKGATNAGEKPKGAEVDERLGDQPVKLELTRANGESVTVEMPAKKAAKRVSERLATLAKIIDCLGGKTA